MMSPKTPLALVLVILFSSFSFSLCRYHKGPLSNYPYDQAFYSLHGQYDNHRSPNYGLMTRLIRRASSPSSSPQVFNVDDFGAGADGTDDSPAFSKAWKMACSSRGSVVLVPEKKVYYLKPIKFSGPCKSYVTMRISGVIKASPRQSDYEKDRRHWIQFEGVNNLRVEGGGTINGNGRTWWQNSCKINEALPCKHAPTAVTFLECNNLEVANLRFKDAQQMHMTFQKCVNVKASNLQVIAPENSPNTDGIHVTESQNVQIMNSIIRTGDDCISIVSGSKNVRAMDITCGPGHGISIGSLGADNSEAVVSNVIVNRATFSGTTNGVRIKTWQGGSGYAKNIIFQNISMRNVSNPIIIDQNYCDEKEPCHEQVSAVQVSDVTYSNIKGTSDSKVAVKFDCSRNFPCKRITLRNVHFVPEDGGDSVEASCENVWLNKIGSVSPKCN